MVRFPGNYCTRQVHALNVVRGYAAGRVRFNFPTVATRSAYSLRADAMCPSLSAIVDVYCVDVRVLDGRSPDVAVFAINLDLKNLYRSQCVRLFAACLQADNCSCQKC